jgi:hypothetical protein
VRARSGRRRIRTGLLAAMLGSLASLLVVGLPDSAGAAAGSVAARALERTVDHLARVVVQTAPVHDDGSLVAVVGVQTGVASGRLIVLGYQGARWKTLARLAVSDFPIVPANPVPIADVTGLGRPDFLVLVAAADNTPGVVVGQVAGRWELIPNAGPFPTSAYVAREPAFRGDRLVSQYDNCTPNCAAGTVTAIDWTFDRSRGEFTAPNPPGWVAPAGALNHSG